MQHDVLIGLGSNQGERAEKLAGARARLEDGDWLRIMRCSPLYESEPWGPVPQPWYLNQICLGQTGLSPRALMRWLLAVEHLGGRDRTNEQRWGPRAIDIDLLAYNRLEYRDHLVEVPHPRLHERRFVLEPLAVVAPGWRHPRLDLTPGEML
ncbi:MAG: 2-amino-4-hydroxy-6-hydroxymethyldihydropteridine diphosphokinase, partial [Ardenticatenaceae bacterium]